MLGCFWGIQKFRNFVWGRPFTLRTDHKPLLGVLVPGHAIPERVSQRICNWYSRLFEHNFRVVYLPGINNRMSDCLSRLLLPIDEHEFEPFNDGEMIAHIHESNIVNAIESCALTKRQVHLPLPTISYPFR